MRKTRERWSFWLVDHEGRQKGEAVTTEGWTWDAARETAVQLLGVDPQSQRLRWKGTPFT